MGGWSHGGIALAHMDVPRMGGSVLLVAVWHTAFNFTSATPAASGAVAAITSTLVMVVAVAIVILDVRSRRMAH